MRSQKVSHGAKLAYALMAEHSKEGECDLYQAALASALGISTRQFGNYLRELTKAELIYVVQRGSGRSNLCLFRKRRSTKQANSAGPG
jgi:hypothetical protein